MDQFLTIFTQMADYDQIVMTLKEKEISSQNVQQVFTKLQWKHLIGLECLSICFNNKSVLKNTQIQSALEVLSKDAHLLILLSHRNFMVNMHAKSEDQFQNLETLSQQLVGPQIGGYSRSKFEVVKICKQTQISDDENFKLNPYHFEKLIQECVVGLINNSEKMTPNNAVTLHELLQSLGLSI